MNQPWREKIWLSSERKREIKEKWRSIWGSAGENECGGQLSPTKTKKNMCLSKKDPRGLLRK